MFNLKGAIIGAVAFVGLVFGWFAFTETISQGHAGVVFSKSSGVQDETLPQGFTFVNPLHKITEYPVSTETITYEKLPLATVDGKPLDVDITIEYFNNVEKLPYIYNKFKGQKPEAIEQNWLKSRAKDSALEVTSKYTILEVFQSREAIKVEILEQFKKDVEQHGFIIENVVFGTPQPDENTAKAIQAVVDAQQDLEKLKIDKQKAKEIAEKQLIEAQGQADAERERAKGTADANKILSNSITEQVLKMEEIKARQKHGWVEVQTGQAIVDNK
jgi:prohibitin 1